jgi:hypothetical protein
MTWSLGHRWTTPRSASGGMKHKVSDFNTDKFNCAKCSNLALVKEGEESWNRATSHELGAGNVLGADGLR